MTIKTDSSDSASIKPILAALAKRVPKARLAEAQAFATAFYRRMSGDEFAQHAADGWAELAADMLEFARARKRGKANVRLFNPAMKEDGWESPHTVVQVVNDDMPFLVDSVTMALAEQGIGVHVLGHPVMSIARDKAGKLTAVGEGALESFIHLEVDRQPQAAMAAWTSLPIIQAGAQRVSACGATRQTRSVNVTPSSCSAAKGASRHGSWPTWPTSSAAAGGLACSAGVYPSP